MNILSAHVWQRPRIFASRFGATVAFSLLLPGFSFGPIAQAEPRGRSFPIPTGSQPISITEGPDGNLWFTLQNSSQVARITPDGVITEFRTPTFSFPFDITPGPDGNVWFSEGSTGQIGFITPLAKLPRSCFRFSMPPPVSPPGRMVTSGFVI